MLATFPSSQHNNVQLNTIEMYCSMFYFCFPINCEQGCLTSVERQNPLLLEA